MGVNCLRAPEHTLPVMEEMRGAVSDVYLAAQPVAFHGHDHQPNFVSLPEFPYELEKIQLPRAAMADFAVKAREMGYDYIGSCCGSVAAHVRAMAERWASGRPRSASGGPGRTSPCPATSCTGCRTVEAETSSTSSSAAAASGAPRPTGSPARRAKRSSPSNSSHLGHDKGGSEDHSRIIRLSYHAPEYTALTPHTYEAWSEVEDESGARLVIMSGGLDLEPVDDEPRYINKYSAAMRAAGIPHQEISAREVMERFPQFRLDGGVRAVYQADAGIVDAAQGKRHPPSPGPRARRYGARQYPGPKRTASAGERGGRDGRDLLRRGVSFVAAGAWTNRVLRHVGIELPITCTQEQVTYFRAPDLGEFSPERFPVWIWHGGPESSFYGVPVYGEPATKAGQDVGGDVVTVDNRTFEPNERVRENLRSFLERYIPGSVGPELYTRTCLYDMPPDRELVLGTLPEHPHISVFNGAGHGFKFASLAGKILSELAMYGETRYPIEAFRVDRPALTDPAYEPVFLM